jgi:hypothetical protein
MLTITASEVIFQQTTVKDNLSKNHQHRLTYSKIKSKKIFNPEK